MQYIVGRQVPTGASNTVEEQYLMRQRGDNTDWTRDESLAHKLQTEGEAESVLVAEMVKAASGEIYQMFVKQVKSPA